MSPGKPSVTSTAIAKHGTAGRFSGCGAEGFPLKDAVEAEGKGGKNGKDYLTNDPDVLRKGKVAFADHCARCHSSKQPDGPLPARACRHRTRPD